MKTDKTEETSLLAAQQQARTDYRELVMFIAVSTCYIVISSSLIVMNKYVVAKDRFPYPVLLTFMHTVFCSVVSIFFYKLMPSFYPAITNPNKAIDLHDPAVGMRIFSIGFLFAATLVMNNSALLFSDISSLQMIKESIVVMVYFWSVILNVERFGFGQLGILMCLMMATTAATGGELNFSLVGFILQFTAMITESGRTVLQNVVLSGKGGVKLDPLSFLMVVSPVCIVCVGIALAVGHTTMVHVEAFALPTVGHLLHLWPLLLLNCCLAFMLNLSLAFMLKLGAPVSVVLTGITRDCMIVFGGALLFHQTLTVQQTASFLCQIALIAVWSATKLYPDRFPWIKHGPPSARSDPKDEARAAASKSAV